MPAVLTLALPSAGCFAHALGFVEKDVSFSYLQRESDKTFPQSILVYAANNMSSANAGSLHNVQ